MEARRRLQHKGKVTHHTSHVTHHTSRIKRHTSRVTRQPPTLFAFANLSASGTSPTPCPPHGDVAPLAHTTPMGVTDVLSAPPLPLLRGVVRTGAQGEVRGLLLREGAGAALDRIFCRFSVAWRCSQGKGQSTTRHTSHVTHYKLYITRHTCFLRFMSCPTCKDIVITCDV